MNVILVFVVFVLVGDTAAVFIAYLFERVSNFASLLVFLGLFIPVFGVAWNWRCASPSVLSRAKIDPLS